jgi:hypothetical protein
MAHPLSFKSEIKTFMSEEEQLIVQEMNRVVDKQKTLLWREVMNLRDEGVRQALIEMGWTPPTSTSDQP